MTLISITLLNVRSRATWYEQGEKSNKYFLGLESNRGNKSFIRRMFTSKGTLVFNQTIIMAEIENFYLDLYASNKEEEVADPIFVSDTRNYETDIRHKTCL